MWFGCVFTPQPLRPAAAGVGGGPGEAHCASASRPPGPAQPPLTDTRCTHVRAGLLLLLAVVRPTTGSLLPSPSPNQYHCLSRCGTRASPSLLVFPLSSSRLHGRSKKEATCAVRRTPAVALPPACPWRRPRRAPLPFTYPVPLPPAPLPASNSACPPLAAKFSPPPCFSSRTPGAPTT